jgi:YidC/Oxa1 family membrane protein insertase
MEKRLILAFGLTIIVFLIFQQFQQRNLNQAVKQNPSQQVQPIVNNSSQPTSSVAAEERPKTTGSLPSDTKAAAQSVLVKGKLYRAAIDNRGGVLTSWQLNQYKSSTNDVFEMIAASNGNNARLFPGSLLFDDASITSQANAECYEVLANGKAYDGRALEPPAVVTLKLKKGNLEIEKTYSFENDNDVVNLSASFRYADKSLAGKFFLGEDIGPEKEHMQSSSKLEVAYFSGGKVKREGAPKDESEIKRIEGEVTWVGLDMQYFTMIAIPSGPLPYFAIQKRPVKAVGVGGKLEDRDLLKVTIPANGSLQYQIYIGPKNQADLKAVKAADISGVINYGMFSILVMPLLASLRWIFQYVHNYGLAIIVLTFLLSLLLFPFRLKQMISMKKMQAVQPKVKAIQEKYRRYKKTDPKRAEMNQEIMGLYKEHNVNPLGGCLPLLLQMPLLFAFYSLLANSIELRQAPFIWWITDLSLKDPKWVLPIVMGITSFISQKMTPMAPGTDPAQAKVMMVMPAIFTVMFINLSSGLNLYFLCSNIFQIGFQKIAERWIGDGKSERAAKA